MVKISLCKSDGTGFLSDCPSLKFGIAIRCIQYSEAMLERGVCELAHYLFHSEIKDRKQRNEQRKKGQADKEEEKGIRFLSMKGGRY